MHKQKKDIYRIFDRLFLTPNEKTMLELINYSLKNDLNDIEILYLANGLANSGQRIKLDKITNACDIPSSGGPSSLSTLICPLYLKLLGNDVLKLGVPGRPAGGIDVLAQISGYNINPNQEEINKWIESTSYVHFLANDDYAPLDAKLFKFRKENNAIDIPSLVIASLLSKKLAVGLKSVGLDIRVSSYGNFGKNWNEARKNGIRFNRVAKLAGIKSKCFLTNNDIPQQPYIGRGESILALQKIFSDNMDFTLAKHLNYCYIMANSISFNKKPNNFPIDLLKDTFLENIKIQGGETSSFSQIAIKVQEQHQYKIYAKEDGVLSADMDKIRQAIVKVQNKHGKLYSDPCGIIFKIIPNNKITKGDIICSFRCESEYKNEFENDLNLSLGIAQEISNFSEFEEIQ